MHKVPNRLVDMDSRKRSACYPQSSLYPLSPIPPTWESRITNTRFRVCSACPPRSQAGLCVCTQDPGFHSGWANLCTPPLHFWRQPPQLNCPPDSVLHLDFYAGASKISSFRREVFHIARKRSLLFSTVKIKSSVSSYSKASWGLFVHVWVGRIFTAISISPGNGSRQSLCRSTFRAGRNLPDKEFRYHRTVIVTAAVHRSLHDPLDIISWTMVDLPALGRCQPLYVALRLRRDLCFS